MARKKKQSVAQLVLRSQELMLAKKALYAEYDLIMVELSKAPKEEVWKTGHKMVKAFEKGNVEFGMGPVREWNLKPLNQKEVVLQAKGEKP